MMTVPRLASWNTYFATAAELPLRRMPLKLSVFGHFHPNCSRIQYRKCPLWSQEEEQWHVWRPCLRTPVERSYASGIHSSQSWSSAGLERIVRKQISSNADLLEKAVVRLFDDSRSATKSILGIKLVPVVRTGVCRPLNKAFQSVIVHVALKQGANKFLAELYINETVKTRAIDATSISFLLAGIV